ncbi:uncharacterized protein LOC129774525 [Toxorhynchites rutilus septentrionalis]|uniref:uncharacterized protein LOC129774525 n=1 Tax=Toxorhynchites rutilus septentrionalis TaxID=329112 RepID=UPI002478C133|nr:uncharacterized protein LOC129774525 [Toxorhynchites rutilus septentrionalis]
MPTKRTPVKNDSAAAEVASSIEALSALRGAAQGKITRIMHLLQQAEVEQKEISSQQVKVWMKRVEAANNDFDGYHQQIVSGSPALEQEKIDNRYVQFEEIYNEVTVKLEMLLERQAQPAASQPIMNPPPLVIQQSLPRAIPTFDGRYEHWEKFKIMFRDVVDRSNEPPRIKLYHLEKALVGGAAKLIDARTLNEGNYDRAWQLLEERYENKRRMIDLHIRGLLSMQKIVKENYSELQKLVETFSNHVENLKFLGQEFTGVSEQIAVYMLTQSIDGETKKLWEATIRRGELPNFDLTVQFLKERVSILERCQTTNEVASKHQRASSKPSWGGQSIQRSNAAIAPAVQQSQCDFCSNSHPSYKCPEFCSSSLDQRLLKVKERNCCFNCLRRGHRVLECPSKRTCFKCQRKHHTLLHNDKAVQNSNVKKRQLSQTSVAVESTTTFEENAAVQSTVTSALSNTRSNPISQVVLYTALVKVLDRDQQIHQCRALLDCGSQLESAM